MGSVGTYIVTQLKPKVIEDGSLCFGGSLSSRGEKHGVIFF